MDAPQLPGDFAARVARRIDRAERGAARRSRRALFWRWSAAAAAILLGVVSAAFFRSPPEVGLSPPIALAPRPHVPGAPRTPPAAPESPAMEIGLAVPVERPLPTSAEDSQGLVFATSRVASFGHVVDMAHRIAPDARKPESVLRDDPCKPDPNKDGRTDITDVAYSCQVLLAGQRVMAASFAMDHAPASLEPATGKVTELVDCDESCVRA